MRSILTGYVLSVGRKTFWCRLHEPGKKKHSLEANVAISKLTAREKPFLKVGAYVSLLKGGTWRFVRLRPWSRREVMAAKARAAELAKAFGWYGTPHSHD